MKKSVIFIYLISSILSISCCDTDDPAPINQPEVTSASTTVMVTVRSLNISWTHSVPTDVSAYKVQYSVNHADWVTYSTVGSSVNSLVNSPLGNIIPFYHNVKWRVVAVENSGIEVPSSNCKATSLASILSQQSTYAILKLVGDYDVNNNQAIQFEVTPAGVSSMLNMTFALRRWDGTAYVPLNSTVVAAGQMSLPYIFNLDPANLLQVNERYELRATSTGGQTNSILFTYAPPPCM